jgi:hypothetical protein
MLSIYVLYMYGINNGKQIRCILGIYSTYCPDHLCTNFPRRAVLHVYFVYLLGSQHIQLIVMTTEYTQSGKGRFLASILSCRKTQPWLVRVGGARPPLSLYCIYHHVQCCSVRWEGRYVHSSYFISTLYVLCGDDHKESERKKKLYPYVPPFLRGRLFMLTG